MRLIYFLMIFIPAAELKSQLNPEWTRAHNGSANGTDEATTLECDSAGNIYSAGKVQNSGTGFDIFAVKYNSSGILLWSDTYNGPGNGNDIAYSSALDNSGNLYVAGESKGDNTDRDYILIKYNTTGDRQWIRRYNGSNNNADIASKVILDNSGNPVITGHSSESGTMLDIVTIKYSSNGDLLWKKNYNGNANGNDLSNDIALDNIGDIYVAGSTLRTGTLNDLLVIKYSGEGEELWTVTYNGTANGNDNAASVTADNNGNVIFTGSSAGSGSGLDYVTIKLSPDGGIVWIKRFSTTGVTFDEPKDIVSDHSGNVFVTGTSTGFSTSYDYLTVKYSSTGEEMWSKRYNGPLSNNFDEPRSIEADIFGNVYVSGLSEGSASSDDILTIKYDSQGNELWVNRYNSAANNNDAANCLILDNFRNVIVSGYLTGTGSGRDFSLVKFSQLTIMQHQDAFPVEFCLYQNYPNPFNPVTKIKYSIKNSGNISIKLFDITGKEVAVLTEGFKSPGTYELIFNATDLASGIYFYKMISGDKIISKNMNLIK